MAPVEPQIDFANLDDLDIANFGLDAVEAAFENAQRIGLPNSNSFILDVGVYDEDDEWQPLRRRRFGPDAERFAVNIDPKRGKLATVLYHHMDSVDAFMEFGDGIPEGPQRYTGGVFYEARVLTAGQGWMTRSFVAAASGLQGPLDADMASAAVRRMGTLWSFKMEMIYGTP